jgi:hypothetical protein
MHARRNVRVIATDRARSKRVSALFHNVAERAPDRFAHLHVELKRFEVEARICFAEKRAQLLTCRLPRTPTVMNRSKFAQLLLPRLV